MQRGSLWTGRVGLLTAGAATAAALVTWWATSIPGGWFGGLLAAGTAWLVVGLAWLAGLVTVLALRLRPARLWSWAVAPVLLVATYGLVKADVPLLVRFHLSEPALTAFASSGFTAGVQGASVGLYDIEFAENLPEGALLVVRDSGFIDRYGFAWFPEGVPAKPDPTAYEHLSGDWYVYTWRF
ncbi:hypothetical protein [Nonomuraea sp. NPDC050310]|uniref:hypothetical protein n=1 Tax=Nonomuraea sp. NPDC050310 TaxID=3154935 RepID=UPI0033EA0C94